jgi:hypothetical protein
MSVADEIVRTVQDAETGFAANMRAAEAREEERAKWHELGRVVVIAFVMIVGAVAFIAVIGSLDCDMCRERARTQMGNCTLDAEDHASIDACTRQFEVNAAACETKP